MHSSNTCLCFLTDNEYLAVNQTERRGRHRHGKVVKLLCNSKLAMALLPLQLCPPPPQDVVGWVKGWLAASWNGPFVLSPMLCQSHGPTLYQKKMPPSLLREQSLVPLSPALYHSRKTFYQVSCHLPASERPVRLSNSTLSKFICRHIPLH